MSSYDLTAGPGEDDRKQAERWSSELHVSPAIGDTGLPEPEALVERIRAGDENAEAEFFATYYRKVLFLLRRKTDNTSLAEDLAQETMIIVLKRLREQGLDDPDLLGRFIQRTAKFVHIGWLRKRDNQNDNREDFDAEYSGELTPVLQMEREEMISAVREMLSEIRIERDREILTRYYVADQDKKTICDALQLQPDQFDKLISRARKRFKEAFQARGRDE